MNTTQAAFVLALALLLALAAIFIRTPEDPRCSYDGLSPLHKIIFASLIAALALTGLANF